MRVLAVHAGSSSLKLRLLDQDDTLLAGEDLGAVGDLADGELATALDRMRRSSSGAIEAVGHRIVHGGTRFSKATRIDAEVAAALRELTDLAPLHQPKSLAALDAVSREMPDLPAVACFDTAFHTTLSDAASTFAVPREWRAKYGVRRYGFHGLSHAYCARRTAQLIGLAVGQLRLVSCHLGAGASLAAIVGGRSVDTTMGFTPLDGLVMATRSGSIDPGMVLWLEEHERVSPHVIADALEHRSGLLALADTADMREVERRATSGDPSAQLALDVFIHRLVTGIGAMAAAAGGLDALTFTGGIGEHSPGVRRLAAERLAHLGLHLDMERNDDAEPDADIGESTSVPRAFVITAREDLQIAREVRDVLVHANAGELEVPDGQGTAVS
jgi:acetate kinase